MSKLHVIAKRDGYRRAGIVFGRVASVIDTDALRKAQVDAIRADPHLKVVAVEPEKSEKKGKA
ncbi:MAG: hypothetical protein JSS03_00740 [Proteobacteria bacterium]|nr:hypothetical protein [Pseudomonadota bacterium]